MSSSLAADSQPHTPVKQVAPDWLPSQPYKTTTMANSIPPDIPIPTPPIALASPFHPGTTLGSSSASKVDRFQDVRNLFAKRQLQRQNSQAVQAGPRRCFCDKELEDEEDIYCSSACARTDAMSSLCFAEKQRTAAIHTNQSSVSSLSSVASSSVSGVSTSTSTHTRTASDINLSPSQASHYRRMTSEELKRQRTGHSRNASYSSRRRGREDGTSQSGTSIGSIASVVSTGFSRVPELVGGHPYAYTPSHSRNTSTASSNSSGASAMLLPLVSRHVSATTSHSRHGSAASGHLVRGGIALAEMNSIGVLPHVGLLENGGLTNVKEEMEDDIERLADAEDDAEYTNDERSNFYPTRIHDSGSFPETQAAISARHETLSFEQINRALAHGGDEPFGMGRDMQDVLDEIIMMEKGFHVNSSESEQETDGEVGSEAEHGMRASKDMNLLGGSQSRPRTPLLGLEASQRKSIILPSAPLRSAHHSNDYSCLPTPAQPLGSAASINLSRMSRVSHMPSRSEPSLDTWGRSLDPSESLMSQLPSAFEDAIEEEAEHGTDLGRFSLAEGRRSFARRSRSEVRRSLTFAPPTGYRASLLASIREGSTPKPHSLRTPVATMAESRKRRGSLCVSMAASATDARMSAHPYRRSVLVDDSVTRFQFPRTSVAEAMGDVVGAMALTVDTMIGRSLSSSKSVLLEPLLIESNPTTPVESMEINTPTAPDFAQTGQPNGVVVEATAEEPHLAPSLFPASSSPVEAQETSKTITLAPHSGLRLGVLLGSGVDDRDDDDWYRSARRNGDESDAMDVEDSPL
ncbi:hypothetical protein QFC20_005381 [Naganishia adeliensis]|uniref:Uncharacterized protein n=1 Tax=Naganishia adeliensis TaxID=92952 RepID=A0ACC2VQV9_9TREE|nr:hypothetical protein QFC20_005381 [Naganishia adeliensis]